MLGLRFFSLFTLLLASLFVHQSFDAGNLIASSDQLTSAQKHPHIQNGEVTKLLPKQKSHTSFFIFQNAAMPTEKFSGHAENFSGFVAFFPKPPLENPSRAPPVV